MGGCASSKTADDKDDLKNRQKKLIPPLQIPTDNNNNNNKNSKKQNAYFEQNNTNSLHSNSFLNETVLNEFFDAVGNGDLNKLTNIINGFDLDKKKKKLKADLLNAGMHKADGLTALSIAAGRKHEQITEYLADLPEVDVNKASESGITPLLMVAEVGWTHIMEKLLRRGAQVDAAPKGKALSKSLI